MLVSFFESDLITELKCILILFWTPFSSWRIKKAEGQVATSFSFVWLSKKGESPLIKLCISLADLPQSILSISLVIFGASLISEVRI